MYAATEVKSMMEVTIEISDKKRAAIQMGIEICEVASTMKSAMEVVTKMKSAMDDGKMHMEASEMYSMRA